jgi:hypothetical protein
MELVFLRPVGECGEDVRKGEGGSIVYPPMDHDNERSVTTDTHGAISHY